MHHEARLNDVIATRQHAVFKLLLFFIGGYRLFASICLYLLNQTCAGCSLRLIYRDCLSHQDSAYSRMLHANERWVAT